MAKIYVSSTFLDLQDYRAQVERVIRRMGHEDVAMEYYVASDERPAEKCLADVAVCDIYIGVYAWRYGWVPAENNPRKLSITELEYREAENLSKLSFIFLLSDKQPWPLEFVDDDRTEIKRFRNDASARHTADHFTTSDDLGRKVAEAIHKWEKEYGYISTGANVPQFDREGYYNAMRRRYGVIALEGLTPAALDEDLPLQLRSVFIEQNVRENPPPVELPKHLLDKLIRGENVHQHELPEGVTIDDIFRARETYFNKPSRPVLDVLTDATANRTLILGDPGSGKSTLARFVLLSILDPDGAFHSILDASREAMVAEEEKRDEQETVNLKRRMSWASQFENHLPLLIELRNFVALRDAGKCETFFEFLEYLGKTEGWHLNASVLKQYLKNDGRAVVTFDGLDEIFDPALRDHITQQIVAFTEEYPKARVLVTSRVIGYRRKILAGAHFKHFTLQDLDEKQVATFVNRWFGLALTERPDEVNVRRERVMRAFNESSSIRQLAGNPMLLTIMVIIGKHQELPRERWKLYDHAASVLIQHWDVNKHLQDKRIQADFVDEDDKKALLRRLASRMQSGEGGLAGNYIHRHELQTEFEAYLKERYNQSTADAAKIARAMIDQFRERNFILSLYGANLYGFVHRAFLEYFCAWEYVWEFERAKEITIEQLKENVYGKHCEDQSWHEVLLIVCGMLEEKFAGEIIDYLTDDVYFLSPLYFFKPWNISLAVRCLSQVRNMNLVAEPAKWLLQEIFNLVDRFIFDGPGFVDQYIMPSVEMIGKEWPNRHVIIDWLEKPRMYPLEKFSPAVVGRFVGLIGGGLDKVYKEVLSFKGLEEVEYPLEIAFRDFFHSDKEEDSNYLIFSMFVLATGWHDDPNTFTLIEAHALSNSTKIVRDAALACMATYYKNDPRAVLILQDAAPDDMVQDLREVARKLLEQGSDKTELP